MDPVSGLAELTLVIVSFAMVGAAIYFMVKLGQQMQNVPGIGGLIASAARAIGHGISVAFSAILGGVESIVGGTFHAAASLFDLTWHVIRGGPAVIAQIARVVGTLAYHVTGLHALVVYVHSFVHEINRVVTRLNREYVGIEHGIKTIEHELAKGIGEDLIPRVKHLERKLAHIENKTIPAIEGVAGQAEADAQTALGKINAIPWNVNWKTWADAITAGLSLVGLHWLFCRLNPFNRNDNACGQLGDLADLLGLIVAVEAALDFDALVHECQDVAEVAATGIMDVFGLPHN